MAVDQERLLINIEANMRRFEREFKKATAVTNTQTAAIERRTSSMVSNVEGRFGSMARNVGASLAAAFTIRNAQQFIDQATAITNALKVVGLEGAALQVVYGKLYASAQKNAAPLQTLVTLYQRVAQSQNELGVSSEAVINFTDNISTLLRVGGTSTNEATGALLQLSQAMGGAVVRAEEFNSINEGAPAILRAAAIGIKEAGGSVAKLRQIMLDGNLSSRALFEGIRVGTPILEKNLAGAAMTTGQAMTRLSNAFIDLAKRFNDNSTAAQNLNRVIEKVVQELNSIDVAEAVRRIDTITSAIERVVNAFQTAQRGAGDLGQAIAEYLGTDEIGRFLADNPIANALGIRSTAADRERVAQNPGGVAPSAPGRGPRAGLASRMDGFGVEVNIAEVQLPENAISIDDYAVVDEDGNSTKKKARLKSSPILSARKFVGLNENRDKDLLMSAMREQGINIDPSKIAWCAAFMNMILKANGLPGTNSNMARSFLNYGEATNNPRQGDIVVLKRGNNNTSGHVGFVEGFDENGNVRVLGGNQSDGVNVKTFNKNDVLGYRSVPGADRISMDDALTSEIDRRNEVAEAAKKQAASYQEIIATGAEYIVQLQAEAEQRGMTAVQAAAQRYEQDMLNQAQQANITLSDEQREQIKMLAEGMADAEVASENLAETQKMLSELAEGAFKGFAQDLMNGKSAAEAFEGVLGRIADKLMDMALDGLFEAIFSPGKGGGGGGIFGKIFGAIFGGGRAKGGNISSNKMYMVGEKGPELFAPGRTGTIIPNKNMPSMNIPQLSLPNIKQEVKFSINNNNGSKVSAKETTPGNFDIDIDNAIAKKIGQSGTKTHSQFQRTFGVRPEMAKR